MCVLDAKVDVEYKIIEFRGISNEILNDIYGNGIIESEVFVVRDIKGMSNDSILIEVNGTCFALSAKIAAKIMIEENNG
ncbi:MAG: FeoA family protein [Mycoplasmatales bacterium]